MSTPAESRPQSPPTDEPRPTARRGGWPRVVALVAAIAILLLALRMLPLDRYLLGTIGWIRGAGALGVAGFVVAYVTACVFVLPAFLLTLGAGFVYGVGGGVPLVWIAATLGAGAAFLLGRTVAREWVAARIADHPRFSAIDRAVGQQGRKIVLLTRLSPVFPFTLINYLYALTAVGARDYMVGTAVGMLPGVTMYVYIGSLITSLTELASGRGTSAPGERAFYFAGLAATWVVTIVVARVAQRALADAMRTSEPAAGAAPAGSATPPGPGPTLTDDAHDQRLRAQVRPPGWRNPTPAGRYNLVVLGGGTAGLVSAAGAAGLGARVALVERHLLGGDCLNVGCVPSKALIAAARAAAAARRAGALGVRVERVEVDFPAVMERMRRLRADIAPNDGAPRLAGLGVDVHLGEGRFVGPSTVEVDGRRLEFARAVVATGARAAAPPIPGLAEAGYLTNETVFALTTLPRRLVVIGAGPIGCELAQSFAAFGSAVTVLDAGPRVLPREDDDVAEIVAGRLRADGVRLVHGARIDRVARQGGETTVSFTVGGASESLVCDAVLVGAGRAANVEGLGLEAAGIAHDAHGVTVDDFLRTTNTRVYAAGDVAGRHQFTHTADAQARIVLTNALFLGRRRVSALTVPWCTYTTPEVAHVGLYEREARARGIDVATLTLPLHDVDRARLEGDDEGLLRLHVRKGKGTIVGATLVAPHAGETISEVSVAMAARLGLGAIANVIHPYPTAAEVVRKAGDVWNRGRLTPRVQRLFSWWLSVRR